MITGIPELLPLCQPSLLLTPQQPSFFPQPQATPASHQLHTSHSRMGIQTLVRVGGNESIEGARGGDRTRHTRRFSRQTHLNSPTVTKNASKYKAIQAKSPEMAT